MFTRAIAKVGFCYVAVAPIPHSHAVYATDYWALLNSSMISGRFPTSELSSSSGNQGFNKEVGDLGCQFNTSNQQCCLLLSPCLNGGVTH
jgi:hypothetical protein